MQQVNCRLCIVGVVAAFVVCFDCRFEKLIQLVLPKRAALVHSFEFIMRVPRGRGNQTYHLELLMCDEVHWRKAGQLELSSVCAF